MKVDWLDDSPRFPPRATIFRRELLDRGSGPGRHVIQQKPGEPIEFFYVARQGAMKQAPRVSRQRLMRWHAEVMAELDARQ